MHRLTTVPSAQFSDQLATIAIGRLGERNSDQNALRICLVLWILQFTRWGAARDAARPPSCNTNPPNDPISGKRTR